METRQATVSKVRSRSDSGWTVLVMDERDPRTGKNLSWVGVIEEDVQYGDTIQASGEFTVHDKFGAQFKIEQILSVLPQSADGQLAWLASELPGVGPVIAKRLVEAFPGEELWNALAFNDPRLGALPGLTAEKAAEICAAYVAAAQSKEIVSKLVDLGLSINDAKRVWRTLGKGAAKIVEEDPYELMEVERITFDKADLVARRAGLEATDPRRARGYARHLLTEEAGKGHCYVDREALFATIRTITPDGERAIMESKRFVVEGDRVWLKDYWSAEVEIAMWAREPMAAVTVVAFENEDEE